MDKNLLSISRKIDAMREENRGTDKKINALLRTAQAVATSERLNEMEFAGCQAECAKRKIERQIEQAQCQSDRSERQSILRPLDR